MKNRAKTWEYKSTILVLFYSVSVLGEKAKQIKFVFSALNHLSQWLPPPSWMRGSPLTEQEPHRDLKEWGSETCQTLKSCNKCCSRLTGIIIFWIWSTQTKFKPWKKEKKSISFSSHDFLKCPLGRWKATLKNVI